MKVLKRFVDFKKQFEIQLIEKNNKFMIRSINRNENKYVNYKNKFDDYEAALHFAQIEFARICY